MKLTKELKDKIDRYFDNISSLNLYNKLVNEYDAIVEDLNEEKNGTYRTDSASD